MSVETLPTYIERALYGPNGYYSSGNVKFGPDFVTFGERWAPLLADRFFLVWKSMVAQGEINKTEPFHIYEFGAGMGKMAHSILKYLHGRALLEPTSEWAEFYASVKYCIGEISPELLK